MKKVYYITSFFISIAIAHFSNRAEENYSPPIYCLKRNENCTVYLFGSMHYAEPGSPAITKQLITLSSKIESFYFELVPYGQPQINAKSLFSESEYLIQRKQYFKEFELPDEQLLVKFAEAAQHFLNIGSFIGYQHVYDQAVQQYCGLTRYAGTEESLFRFLAGKDVVLHSIESPSRSEAQASNNSLLTNQTITSKINIQAEKSTTSKQNIPTPSKKDLLEFCSVITNDMRQAWKNQQKCNTIKCGFKAREAKLSAFELNRNINMKSAVIKAYEENSKSLVVIGINHLYGESGVLKLLESDGYSISIAVEN